MNIIRALHDPNLFRPYLQDRDGSISTWTQWKTCLRVIYGLPLRKNWQRKLVLECTHRDPDKLNPKGYDIVLLLCGRRSGKSKIAGLAGAFEASLSGREQRLSLGEIPMVSIVSPTREQSQIIKSYTRAALSAPILDNEVGDDTKDGFPLHNGVRVRILTGDFRVVRGFSQIAVIVDELCFFGCTDESKVKSDTELIRAIKPSLMTTGGRLICVSSKYAPRGWAYSQWKKYFGVDTNRILIWDAASRVMNPTLSEEDIQAEIKDDPAAARSEYLNLWRDDIETYLPREVVEACVVQGRLELLPYSGNRYSSFVDVSGGRNDPMALAIAHRVGRKVVISYLRQWRPPCNPLVVAKEMCTDLKRYGLKHTVGDRYSADWCVQTFKTNGIRYEASAKTKSELYLETLGPICSREIELPDDEVLISQLATLERRTRAGGRDLIDHPPGGHDDLANVVAGVCTYAAKSKRRVGGLFPAEPESRDISMLTSRKLWGQLAEISHR